MTGGAATSGDGGIPGEAGRAHIRALVSALTVLDTRRLDEWGQRLADTMRRGGRLLVAGNGASAAQALQVAAEFTGKLGADRTPRPAIALSAESPSATAATGDFGTDEDETFGRQVLADGRPGDVLLALSASGRSRNVLLAVRAARPAGLETWCLTGPAPNPLAEACDEAVCVYPAGARALSLTATVQEAHQVALHLVYLSFDAVFRTAFRAAGEAFDCFNAPIGGNARHRGSSEP